MRKPKHGYPFIPMKAAHALQKKKKDLSMFCIGLMAQSIIIQEAIFECGTLLQWMCMAKKKPNIMCNFSCGHGNEKPQYSRTPDRLNVPNLISNRLSVCSLLC